MICFEILYFVVDCKYNEYYDDERMVFNAHFMHVFNIVLNEFFYVN